MSLEINSVTLKILVARTKKMIESYFEESCDRAISGDVTPNIVLHAVGSHHHGKSVPAHQALDLPFDILVARQHGLLAHGNRIHIRRIRRKRHRHSGGERSVADFLQDSGSQARLAAFDDCIE